MCPGNITPQLTPLALITGQMDTSLTIFGNKPITFLLDANTFSALIASVNLDCINHAIVIVVLSSLLLSLQQPSCI